VRVVPVLALLSLCACGGARSLPSDEVEARGGDGAAPLSCAGEAKVLVNGVPRAVRTVTARAITDAKGRVAHVDWWLVSVLGQGYGLWLALDRAARMTPLELHPRDDLVDGVHVFDGPQDGRVSAPGGSFPLKGAVSGTAFVSQGEWPSLELCLTFEGRDPAAPPGPTIALQLYGRARLAPAH